MQDFLLIISQVHGVILGWSAVYKTSAWVRKCVQMGLKRLIIENRTSCALMFRVDFFQCRFWMIKLQTVLRYSPTSPIDFWRGIKKPKDVSCRVRWGNGGVHAMLPARQISNNLNGI